MSIFVTLALAVSVCFVLPAQKAHAAACTSAGNGNWNAAATWNAPCNVVGGPGAGDTVTITNGNPVTVTANAAATSVTIAGGATATSITINGGISLTVSGAVTINAPTANVTKQIAVGAGTLSAGSITITSDINTRVSQVTLSTGTINVSGNITFGGTAANARLVYTGTGSVNLTGNFGGGGTLTTVAGSILNFNGTTAQTAASYATYNIVKVNNTAGLTMTGASTITTLTIADVTASSVFNDGGFAVTTATMLNLNSGTYNCTAATFPWGTLNAGTGTVNYSLGGAQAVAAKTYHDLTLSGSNTKTAGGSFTIAGDLTITGVTLASAATVQTVNGNINNTGTQTATTGSITLNGGASAHVLSGSGTYANLIMNDALGATLTGNPIVSGVLTLTNGDISTGANTLAVSATCVTGVTGYSASSYVFGNLLLHYPTAGGTTTCTFPIGDATTYAPVTVAILGVTSTLANSTLTAHTDTGDHPDTTAGTSGIDKNYSVNRYWTLTPGGSLIFTTYNPTFTFVAGDIDSGATTSNFIIGRKNISGTWTYPTVSAANPLNTAATGITQANGFNIFAVGEASSISGTVFEDINYGGGAGRSLASSSGVPVAAGVRVELYDNSGNYLTATTTNASGVYRFTRASGTYIVRVVNNDATGIRSTRTGGAVCGATCVPVQTYRTNASTGTPVDVTDHVGGETPTLVDAGDNTTSANLGTFTAQSITTVLKGAANITGVDFGFNFDIIVSIRDTGQGSLRQFIVNANALGGEGTLAQVGQTAGQETSIFMIPHHTAVPGQNIGYADQLTSGGANNGAAVITLATALPDITGNNTSLDATTQTANVGDTNSGTVGTGGTVGTMAQTLQPFNRPEVVIAAAATQLTASGTTVIIKGVAVSNGGITVNGNNSQVRDCLSGMDANGTVTTIYGGNFGVQCGPGTGILVSHNYVKINNSGIRGDYPGANLTIEYNEVDSPNGTPGGGHNNTFDGILTVGTASNVTVQYNLVRNQRGGGLEYGFAGGTVISGTAIGNTISGNGFTSVGARSTEPVGVAVWQLSATSALTIKQNVITGNAGPGLVVIAATNVTITRNSIFTNGFLVTDIGIDLNSLSGDPNNYIAQGVTLNDMNDADTGPNGLLNYPIIESATISGSNLILSGWARPGSVIEFFIAAPDASGGFGSGKTYLTTLTEGSGADTDATSSTYGPGAINGILQGTDNTNRFMFTIAIPAGVASGTVLTATATLSNNSSEFSGNVTVAGLPVLTVLKQASSASVAPGQDIIYTVTITNTGTGVANSVVLTDKLSPFVAFCMNPFTPSTVPFDFAAGTSGLTFDPMLIKYSKDYGSTWSYTPSPPYDGAVTNWQISFPAGSTMAAGNASFILRYRVQVK